MAMGTEVDLHTPHWHGNVVTANGMKTDVVRLVINPTLRSTIAATALAAVDSVTKRIVAGTFTAPTGPATATAK